MALYGIVAVIMCILISIIITIFICTQLYISVSLIICMLLLSILMLFGIIVVVYISRKSEQKGVLVISFNYIHTPKDYKLFGYYTQI